MNPVTYAPTIPLMRRPAPGALLDSFQDLDVAASPRRSRRPSGRKP